MFRDVERDRAALTIRPATEADLAQARALFREYEASLSIDLCFQSFNEEVASLPGRYAPPSGRLLLAERGDAIVGVVAMRDLGDKVCEMKRLFVRPEARGHGVGRALAERVIAEARQSGYRAMRLDTLPAEMGTANVLYDALGFREIPAYCENPVPGARFMELPLW